MSDPEHVTAPVVIDASPPTSDGGPSMTLIEHLAELRRRLIIVVSVVLVGAVGGFFVSTSVLRLLVDLLPSAYQTLYFTSPAGASARSSRSAASPVWRSRCRSSCSRRIGSSPRG